MGLRDAFLNKFQGEKWPLVLHFQLACCFSARCGLYVFKIRKACIVFLQPVNSGRLYNSCVV